MKQAPLSGRYELEEIIGTGGMSVVYRAWDLKYDREVAVKVLRSELMSDEDFIRRFNHEAQAASQMSHPNIVDLFDVGQDGETRYLVMEYVKGSNLAQYVRMRGGKLSVEETLRILRPIMDALDRVHQAGIVHRDISPDNIILEPMGGAKLLDFGAARAVENPEADVDMTRSTEAIVKQGFAPMEQYRSRGGIGPWSDEYALCATIYYCLTGAVPPDAISRSMGEARPDWAGIPGLTDAERSALEKGMSIAAKDRYPSVGELYRALFPETPEPRPIPRPEKPRPSARLKWIAAAGIVVAGVLGILLLTGREKTPVPSGGESAAIRCTCSKGKQRYLDQAAMFYKNGFIDRAEYNLMCERYNKLDLPEGL